MTERLNILVLNGPNLQLLGRREPDIYGSATLAQIMEELSVRAEELGVSIEACQDNEEGALVRRIGESEGRYDGIVLNPAAFTHTSIALRDALQAVAVPCVEVHLSNTAAREAFRHGSLVAAACIGQVMGFGADSYRLALEGLVRGLRRSGRAAGTRT